MTGASPSARTAPNARHWLWVVRPKYYLDDAGEERKDLEPSEGFTPTAWWTCSADTRAGDTALIYRSTEKKDIAYFAVVRSDPEPLDLPVVRCQGPVRPLQLRRS